MNDREVDHRNLNISAANVIYAVFFGIIFAYLIQNRKEVGVMDLFSPMNGSDIIALMSILLFCVVMWLVDIVGISNSKMKVDVFVLMLFVRFIPMTLSIIMICESISFWMITFSSVVIVDIFLTLFYIDSNDEQKRINFKKSSMNDEDILLSYDVLVSQLNLGFALLKCMLGLSAMMLFVMFFVHTYLMVDRYAILTSICSFLCLVFHLCWWIVMRYNFMIGARNDD